MSTFMERSEGRVEPRREKSACKTVALRCSDVMYALLLQSATASLGLRARSSNYHWAVLGPSDIP